VRCQHRVSRVQDTQLETVRSSVDHEHAHDEISLARSSFESQACRRHVVAHHQVEWRRGRTLLLVATHLQVVMVGSSVGEPVNEPGILAQQSYRRERLRQVTDRVERGNLSVSQRSRDIERACRPIERAELGRDRLRFGLVQALRIVTALID
jgi:hypothetical protein